MATEIDIVRDLSHKLDQAGIGYMLTGSMAMNYYAQPRMTRHIDWSSRLARPTLSGSHRYLSRSIT